MSNRPDFDGTHVAEKDAVDFLPLTAAEEEEVRRTEMSGLQRVLDKLGLKR